MRRMILISLALLLALETTGCARFQTGQRAYDRGDYVRARAVWRSLARRDHPEAQYRLALLYAVGQGVPQNEAEAVRRLRIAAQAGHGEARAKLAYLYLEGRGQAAEDPQAEQWLRGAAEEGPSTMQFKLGVLYMKGRGIRQDADEGLLWLRRAASQWPAQGRPIGELLGEEDLLEEAANRGLAPAQLRLGEIYDAGLGVPKSHGEAVKWFYLAAKQGHVPAQAALAWAFAQGTGVPKNPAQSAVWLERAAQRGDAWSQYQLGLAYQLGVGVQRDLVRSHMWFNIAAAKGADRSREKRDEVAGQLTVAQLGEAERLAVAWKPLPAGDPATEPETSP